MTSRVDPASSIRSRGRGLRLLKTLGAVGMTVLIIGFVCALSTRVLGQDVKAGIVVSIQGAATVVHPTALHTVPLKFKDGVLWGDRIATTAQSRARILLHEAALVTVCENSTLTLARQAENTSSVLLLDIGTLHVNIIKGRSRQDDPVQIRTRNAVVTAYGSYVIAEAWPGTRTMEGAIVGGGITSRFTTIRGLTEVTPLGAATGRPAARAFSLGESQMITIASATTNDGPPTITQVPTSAFAGHPCRESDFALRAPPRPGFGPPAGVVVEVKGEATVTPSTEERFASLNVRDHIFCGDRLTTAAQSLARIAVGDIVSVSLCEKSVLTIMSDSFGTTLMLESGGIELDVSRKRIDGDAVRVRTPNATASIRTTAFVEVSRGAVGADSTTTGDVISRFTVVRGLVDVTSLDPATGDPSSLSLSLEPMQAVTIAGSAPSGAPPLVTPVKWKDLRRAGCGLPP